MADSEHDLTNLTKQECYDLGYANATKGVEFLIKLFQGEGYFEIVLKGIGKGLVEITHEFEGYGYRFKLGTDKDFVDGIGNLSKGNVGRIKMELRYIQAALINMLELILKKQNESLKSLQMTFGDLEGEGNPSV